ncbi:DUF2059 domain-containing protein [Phenylobacterium sp.]|uniref:DUF2059 domain-containing protein n=1 Tax=Phenylobacterium sp. TaxID=1871053 RepID=UPI0012016C81|nr:DUF2059 domain-containing protein [Phenylobacterium sp.]THD63814.1 MAG: DUF2059 domain-containing protein [Phenylobacterium sp.]
MLSLRRAAAGFAISAVLLAATPALCADPAPNPRSEALARKLFAEMHMDQMMVGAMRQMAPAMIAQARKANPNLTEEQAKAVTEAVTESMDDVMKKVVDRAIPLYAETFTEKELQDLTDFYNTPSGQAMLAKMPLLMNKMTPLMTELVPQMTADISTRLCSKIDCSTMNTPPKPKT